MEYRILGKTGLRVSEIGYGAAQIGNINLPESQADRALNAVLDAGINFIDTAAMYGQSEARIGKFISHRREEFFLATKCGDYVAESNGKRGIVRDYSRDGILRTIDDSRKKLDMDVIDIVQFHGLPEPDDDDEVAFDALLDARERGWTRFVGVSADGPAAAAAARRWPLDTQEFTYNILYQESAENLMPTLRSLGMGTIIKRPISNAVWQQSERPDGDYMGGPWDRAQTIPLAELSGEMPILEFVLRFTLSHPDVCTAIIGSTDPDHIRANVGISDGHPLSDHIVQKAKAAFQSRFTS